jgi:hypothetical protein
VVGYGGEHWTFLTLEEKSQRTHRVAGYHSVEDLGSHSLMGQQRLSSRRAWCRALCLHALWGRNTKAWSLGFTCVCSGGLLALSNKLKMTVGQQS